MRGWNRMWSPTRSSTTQVENLDARIVRDPAGGREQLRRGIQDGSIRVGPNAAGKVVAEADLLPLVVISDGDDRKENYAKPGSLISRSSTVVAGARFVSISIR